MGAVEALASRTVPPELGDRALVLSEALSSGFKPEPEAPPVSLGEGEEGDSGVGEGCLGDLDLDGEGDLGDLGLGDLGDLDLGVEGEGEGEECRVTVTVISAAARSRAALCL